MRPQLHEHAVVALLRQCFLTPTCQASRRWHQSTSKNPRSLHTARQRLRPSRFERLQRAYSSHDAPQQTRFSAIDTGELSAQLLHARSTADGVNAIESKLNIAVLGGGMTGLSSAHYLTKEFPDANITIYEGSDRLGGWVKSKRVEVGSGHVILEQGPRSLRPNTPAGLVTIDMISNLKLDSEVIYTPKNSVAAESRFIYYPDHLVKLPGPGQSGYDMLWSALSEKAFTGLFKAVWEFQRPPRNADIEDESVGDFLSRRLGGPDLVDNIVSAGLHGIYAGDVYQLSARSLLTTLYSQELAHESLSFYALNGFSKGEKTMLQSNDLLEKEITKKLRDDDKGGLLDSMKASSVYTFKSGIGALSEALEKDLVANPNVKFEIGVPIESVEYDAEADNVKIKVKGQEAVSHAHTISSIPGAKLAALTSSIPSLASIHSVTVMVVNLFYTTPDLMPEPGFGYLIPRSVPFEQNPERALGVVFDSYSSVGQDGCEGTKVTVMLGGHWWDAFDTYPDEEEGAAMAKAVLRRHLGRSFDEEPSRVLVGLQRECIPQYTVGHDARLKVAHQELMSGFHGRLSVAGSSYDGVGLNDCVRSARDAVIALKGTPSQLRENTGLEKFNGPRAFINVKTESRIRLENADREKNERLEKELEKLREKIKKVNKRS